MYQEGEVFLHLFTSLFFVYQLPTLSLFSRGVLHSHLSVQTLFPSPGCYFNLARTHTWLFKFQPIAKRCFSCPKQLFSSSPEVCWFFLSFVLNPQFRGLSWILPVGSVSGGGEGVSAVIPFSLLPFLLALPGVPRAALSELRRLPGISRRKAADAFAFQAQWPSVPWKLSSALSSKPPAPQQAESPASSSFEMFIFAPLNSGSCAPTSNLGTPSFPFELFFLWNFF